MAASGASDGEPDVLSALGDWTGEDADALAELLGPDCFDNIGARPAPSGLPHCRAGRRRPAKHASGGARGETFDHACPQTHRAQSYLPRTFRAFPDSHASPCWSPRVVCVSVGHLRRG